MIDQNAKGILEKFNGYTEEQKLNFLSNLFTWAEMGKTKDKSLKEAHESLDLSREMISMLKAENQKLKESSGGADPAMQEENQRLHAENDKLTAQVRKLEQQSGNSVAWEAERQQLELQVQNLMQEANTQRDRADKVTQELVNESATNEGLAARVQELNEELAKAGNWKEEITKMEQKLDANIKAKREAEQQVTELKKTIKKMEGTKSQSTDSDELAKLRAQIQTLNGKNTKFAADLSKRDARIAQLESQLQGIHKDSAERLALREAKATGIPGQKFTTVMPGVPGMHGSPSISSDGVTSMYQTPQLNKGSSKELEKLREENDRLREDLQLSSERYASLVQEHQKLVDENESGGGDLAEENATLRKQIEALQANQGSTGEITALKSDNKKLEKTIEGLRKEIEDQNTAKETLTVKIRQLEAAGDASKTLAEEKKKLDEKLKEKTEENEKLSARVKELEPMLETYLKEQEAKKQAEEAARAAASSSYEMRVSTTTAEVEKHPDAKYLVTNSGFDGNVRISDNAPRKKAYFVMIDGKAYPNPYFFKDLLTGKQSHNTLQQLRSLFDIDGLDDPQRTYRLVSVEPAQIFVPDQSKKAYEVKQKGKLKVEHLS